MSEREPYQAQVMGKRKYREMIHKDSKRIDDHSNLPFTFSKPHKDKPLNTLFVCENCGRDLMFNEEAILVACGMCKHLNRVRTVIKKGL
jgi:hypothetical protein